MRRLFSRLLLVVAALSPLGCNAANGDAVAAAAAYKEGTHYKPVKEPSAGGDAKRITVQEFFWYGCGHCFAFEPELDKWLKNKAADVEFIRVPNSLGRPAGLNHSRAFYTAEALGVMDKTHHPLFQALNANHQTLDTPEQLAAFFNSITGVLPDVFINTFNGFTVDSRTRAAEDLAKRYGIASTPTIVVAGRWQTNAGLAGGFPEMTKVMDYLINKARTERKK